MGVGGGKSLNRLGYSLLLMHRSQLYTGQPHTKICEGLAISRNIVLNVKKLLNNGVDLTSWIRGGKK
jgi:hypothetical protein